MRSQPAGVRAALGTHSLFPICPRPAPLSAAARFAAAAAEMGEYGVAPGQHVAIVWDSSSPVEALKDLVDKVQAVVGAGSRVSVENVDQLSQCKSELCFPPFCLREGGSAAPAGVPRGCKSPWRTTGAPAAGCCHSGRQCRIDWCPGAASVSARRGVALVYEAKPPA